MERGRAQLQRSWQRDGRAPLAPDSVSSRLPTVQQVLYLQFNEGYSLGPDDMGLRVELCEEAIRLTRMLAMHPMGNHSSTWALLALMHLHSARLPARLDAQGGFVPLAEQDRSRWDSAHVSEGLRCMQQAARDRQYSRYHGEAAIQLEHVLSPDYASTRWSQIVDMYAVLERLSPSPLYVLNRAIVVCPRGTGPVRAVRLVMLEGSRRTLQVLEPLRRMRLAGVWPEHCRAEGHVVREASGSMCPRRAHHPWFCMHVRVKARH